MIEGVLHPKLSFALDVADKIIKFAAVLIGGIWTYWNYRKGRTYEQKLELEVVGTIFVKRDLYGDVKVSVKNIGATRHSVQQVGTFCELFIIRADLTQESIRLLRVFRDNDSIEPGESINDTQTWRLPHPIDDIVWVKLVLRVVSNGVEWKSSCLIRVESDDQDLLKEVN
jgi:hypothetical protein